MNETLIRRHLKGTLVGTSCLLLTALVLGCGQDTGSSVTVVVIEGPWHPAPAAGQEQVSAEATATTETVDLGSCDGEKTVTLKGDNIAAEFQQIVDDYVRRRFGGQAAS